MCAWPYPCTKCFTHINSFNGEGEVKLIMLYLSLPNLMVCSWPHLLAALVTVDYSFLLKILSSLVFQATSLICYPPASVVAWSWSHLLVPPLLPNPLMLVSLVPFSVSQLSSSSLMVLKAI